MIDIQEEFEKWVNKFDLDGDEYEDLGRDEIFEAGFRRALELIEGLPITPDDIDYNLYFS